MSPKSPNSLMHDKVSKPFILYSITIAPAKDFSLGLKSSDTGQCLIRWLTNNSKEYIFTIETTKAGKLHLQAGIITQMRQDNIRAKLLSFYPEWSTDEKKYAIKVKKHNDWQILVNYCSKENEPFDYNLETAELLDNTPPPIASKEPMFILQHLLNDGVHPKCTQCLHNYCYGCFTYLDKVSKMIHNLYKNDGVLRPYETYFS